MSLISLEVGDVYTLSKQYVKVNQNPIFWSLAIAF
jgi:hypothetical protein